MGFKYVAVTETVPVGSMKTFEVAGEKILIVHLEDGFFATQAKCPHLFMPLEKGKLVDGCRVQCKFHRAEFDARTGEACKWANFPPGIQALNLVRGKNNLKTYEVKIEDEQIYVDI